MDAEPPVLHGGSLEGVLRTKYTQRHDCEGTIRPFVFFSNCCCFMAGFYEVFIRNSVAAKILQLKETHANDKRY